MSEAISEHGIRNVSRIRAIAIRALHTSRAGSEATRHRTRRFRGDGKSLVT